MADRQQPIVLCLHGWGSRPQVFEVQLRTLVKPLRDLGHKVVFAEAPCSLWMGKLDVVRTFGGPYFGWYQKETSATLRNAIAAVHEQHDLYQVGAIIGFSQGATLGLIIASLLEHDQLKHWLPESPPEASVSLTAAHIATPSMSHGTSSPCSESESNSESKVTTRGFMSKVSSWASTTTTNSSVGETSFTWTSTGSPSSSSATSITTGPASSQLTLPLSLSNKKHKLRFIVALCPISTAWTPENGTTWLPSIPAFCTVGETDRYKTHSINMAAKISEEGSSKLCRVETFAFGHEVPRCVKATRLLLDFVKEHSRRDTKFGKVDDY